LVDNATRLAVGAASGGLASQVLDLVRRRGPGRIASDDPRRLSIGPSTGRCRWLACKFWKVIVWDKVLGFGATDPITGMIADWTGMIITAYVSGRSVIRQRNDHINGQPSELQSSRRQQSGKAPSSLGRPNSLDQMTGNRSHK
jgi:hypothetical protein